MDFQKTTRFALFGFTIMVWFSIRKKNKKKKAMKKNNFFSKDNLRQKSLSTLYRIKRAEKKSEGTFAWYLYPSNAKKVLNEAIQEKLDEMKKLPPHDDSNGLSIPA